MKKQNLNSKKETSPEILTSILELCNGVFIIKKANLSFIIELAIITFLLS